MTKTQFRQAIKRGSGRCFIELSTGGDREKYRSIVLWGCLHNLSFDTQCEGTRAEYLYELASLYHDDEYFLTPTIDRFEKISGEDDWYFAHLSELLGCFAKAGSESARMALHRKYDKLYPKLLKKRRCNRYDYDRDNFERVCVALVSAEGERAFLKIARDMGNLFLINDRYDGFDFEWFYDSFEERIGEKRLSRLLEREGKKSREIMAFYDGIKARKEDEKLQHEEWKRSREQRTPPLAEDLIAAAERGELEIKDCVGFRLGADETQKLLLAETVLKETDSDKKADLLRAFDGGFPLRLEEIVAYAKSDHERLRDSAFCVLSESRGAAVHDFAIELLQEGQRIGEAISMLIFNYRKEDKALLLSSLDQLKISYSEESGWHSVTLNILKAFRTGIRLPKETLLFIYHRSLCSVCRECAVKELAKHGRLSDEIAAECAYDSNFDLRDFVRKKRKGEERR